MYNKFYTTTTTNYSQEATIDATKGRYIQIRNFKGEFFFVVIYLQRLATGYMQTSRIKSIRNYLFHRSYHLFESNKF